MRSRSADHTARVAAGTWRLRVEVKDASGAWRDLTTLPGFNAVKAARWREDVDSPGWTASLELFRNLDAISLSPFHSSSPLNRSTPWDGAAGASSLIALRRELRLSWALQAELSDVPAWTIAFDGQIDSFDDSDPELLTIECRGQYAELQDRIFEEEFVFAFMASTERGPLRLWQPNTAYALNERVVSSDGKRNGKWYTVTTAGTSGATEPTWPGAGTVADGSAVHTYGGTTSRTAGHAVENVLLDLARTVLPVGSAMFGDFDDKTTVKVYTPSSPGWAINIFQVSRGSVWDEMQKLAQQIGWDLRWKWDDAQGDFRLTFLGPPRTKTTPDYVFTFGTEVRGYDSLSASLEDIRNVVAVVYVDGGDLDAQSRGIRKMLVRTDSASVAKYGRRFMEVAESSNSNIDSATEAQAMADAILSDLAEPTAELAVELAFFPWVEIGDLCGFPADNRRFTAQQNLAVVGIEHAFDESGCSTHLVVRGKPASGGARWQGLATPANPDDMHTVVPMQNAGNSAGLAVKPSLRGAELVMVTDPWLAGRPSEFEFHVSSSSGFTPSSATLVGKGRAGQVITAQQQPGAPRYAKVIGGGWNAERYFRSQPSEEVAFTAGYVEPCDLNPETLAGQPKPPNGSFEGWFAGSSSPPDHWTVSTGAWTTDFIRATGAEGAYAIQCRNSGSAIRAEMRSAWFPVTRSKTLALDALLIKVGSTDGSVRLTVEFGDAAKSVISSQMLVKSVAGLTSWTKIETALMDVPSTAAFARVYVGRDASGTYEFGVDGVTLSVAGEPLVVPSLGANWADYGGGYTGVTYWRDALGLVHLRGLVQSSVARGTVPVTIFTLPAGFRPLAREIFTCARGGSGADTFCRVDVAANGDVILMTTLSASDWVSLAGIVFDVR